WRARISAPIAVAWPRGRPTTSPWWPDSRRARAGCRERVTRWATRCLPPSSRRPPAPVLRVAGRRTPAPGLHPTPVRPAPRPGAHHCSLLPALRGGARPRGGPARSARARRLLAVSVHLLSESEARGRHHSRAGRPRPPDPTFHRPGTRPLDVSGRL